MSVRGRRAHSGGLDTPGTFRADDKNPSAGLGGAFIGRLLVAALCAGAIILEMPAAALAGPSSIPPIDDSFYVYPGDTPSTAYTLGCDQGNYDGQVNQDSVVILDFGAQTSDSSGTYLPSSSTFWSNGSDEFYAANFAEGYQGCNHGKVLTLAVATNNDGSVTDGHLGAVWGTVVQAVANNAQQSGYVNVSVAGAGDWEAGFGPFAHLNGWVNGDGSGGGYVSTYSVPLFDFGSADGCPQQYGQYQNIQCTGDWYQSSNWYAAWGWGPAYATPEIYYNGCDGNAAQDLQWGMISLEGAVYQGSEIPFTGPMTSAGTCDTPVDAYIDLWNVINNNSKTAMTPSSLLQITTV